MSQNAQNQEFHTRLKRIRSGKTIQQASDAEGTKPCAPPPRKRKVAGTTGMVGAIMAVALASIFSTIILKTAPVSAALTGADVQLPIPGDTRIADLILVTAMVLIGMRILSVVGWMPKMAAAATAAFLFAPAMGAEQVPAPTELWSGHAVPALETGLDLTKTHIVPLIADA
ncbi:MAG: hypothetical protein AAGG69_16240 [Pseudomonadota bacterium]